MKVWQQREFLIGLGAGMFGAAAAAAFFAFAQGSGTSVSVAADQLAAAKQAGIEIGKQQALDHAREVSEKPPAADKGQQPAVPAPGQTVWVYIPAGLSLTEIANMLQAAQICEDGNALIRLAGSQNATIRSGFFALPKGGDPNAILKALAGR